MKTFGGILSGIAIALCSMAGTGSGHAQISAEQTLAIGQDLLRSDDYVLAIQYFNKAIKAKPYLPDPFMMRGLAKLMLEDYDGAEADCTAALELNSFKREPYRVRGLARLHLGKDSAALADFESGLAQTPSDRNLLYYRCISESRMGLRERSDSSYEELRRLYPRFTPGYTAHARDLMARGDTAAATALLDRALSYDRYAPEPIAMRAGLAWSEGDWLSAISLYDRAISLSPRNDALYVNRGAARLASGDRSGAMADFSAALEINPDNSQARHDMALCRSANSHKELRICEIPAADISLSPGTARVAEQRAEPETRPFGFFALTFTHPYADGQPVTYPLPELEGINRSHALPSALYLSRTAGETPDAEQAVSLFAFAENLEERRRVMSPPLLLGRAVAYAMLKNHESALTDLGQAIAMRPDLAAPLVERAFVHASMAETGIPGNRKVPGQDGHLAAELLRRESYGKAIEDLDRALAIDPEMAYAWYDKALVLTRMGDETEAIRCYDRAIDASPEMAEAYFNRALLHKRMGNRNAAAADLRRAGELGVYHAYPVLKALK